MTNNELETYIEKLKVLLGVQSELLETIINNIAEEKEEEERQKQWEENYDK